jgi:hypothetical protein
MLPATLPSDPHDQSRHGAGCAAHRTGSWCRREEPRAHGHRHHRRIAVRADPDAVCGAGTVQLYEQGNRTPTPLPPGQARGKPERGLLKIRCTHENAPDHFPSPARERMVLQHKSSPPKKPCASLWNRTTASASRASTPASARTAEQPRKCRHAPHRGCRRPVQHRQQQHQADLLQWRCARNRQCRPAGARCRCAVELDRLRWIGHVRQRRTGWKPWSLSARHDLRQQIEATTYDVLAAPTTSSCNCARPSPCSRKVCASAGNACASPRPERASVAPAD